MNNFLNILVTVLFLMGLFFIGLACFLLSPIVGFLVTGLLLIVIAVILNSEKNGGE